MHDASESAGDGTAPTGSTSAPPVAPLGICCSGGGIRSAAFNLGALQALSEEGVYQKANFVTCVSGGSYIAASLATVWHGPQRDGERADHIPTPLNDGKDYAYAPQSAEEVYLRNSSHYLFPRLSVTVRGLIWIFFGLTANLAFLLVFVFSGARLLGWAVHRFGVVPGLTTAHPRWDPPTAWWLLSPALLAVGLGLLFGENVFEVYQPLRTRSVNRVRQWASWLLAAGAAGALVLLVLPAADVGLHQLALHNQPDRTTARVVAGLGFADPLACRDVAAKRQAGACGAAHADRQEAKGNAENAGKQTFAGAMTFLGALVVLIRRLIKIAGGTTAHFGAKPKKNGADPPGWLGSFLRAAEDRVLPWLGTAIVGVAVTVLTIRWMNDAAIAGSTRHELALVSGAAVLFVLLKTVTDINRTSLHPYYRERLASAYIIRRERSGPHAGKAPSAAVVAKPVPYEFPLSLAKVAPGQRDFEGPELVICAAANITDESVPPGRGCVSFTFSNRCVGLAADMPPPVRRGVALRPMRLPVACYERIGGERRITLPAAVAVSAAAVSPLAGKATRPSQRALLALANVRLGLWLPNPLRQGSGHGGCGASGCIAPVTAHKHIPRPLLKVWHQWQQPGPRLLLLEVVGRTHLLRRWIYTTDGGHFDNSGIVEALRREPATILAFDASGDRVDRWDTLGQAIALARAELGVEIDIDPTTMGPIDTQYVTKQYVRGRVWYKPVDRRRPADAELWVCKLGVTQESPWGVRAYARRCATFPVDGTIHQLYAEAQLEAYRALGEDAARQMLRALSRSSPEIFHR